MSAVRLATAVLCLTAGAGTDPTDTVAGAVPDPGAAVMATGIALAARTSGQGPAPARLIERTADERAWLDAHPTIRLAAYANYPPAQFVDEDGRQAGLAGDYVALVAEKLGIEIEHVPVHNWERVLELARSKEVDLIALAARTPDRLAYLSFSEPYLELPAVIIARDSVEGTLTPADLMGLRVAVPAGYAVHDYLVDTYPALTLDPVPDTRTGLRKVAFGMADVFVSDLSAASHYIQEEGITNLRIVGESGYIYRMGFAVRNDWAELVPMLDAALAQITQAEREAIFNRWIHLSHESAISRGRFWSIALAGLAVAGALLAVVFAWNRSLQKLVRQKTEQLEAELLERHRAAEAVRASEARTRLIIDTSLDGVVIIDAAGVVIGWNTQAEAAFGFTAEEAQGRKLGDLIVPEQHREAHARGIERFLDTGEGPLLNRRVEVTALHRDGHELPVELTIAPIEREGTFEFSAFVRDITERKAAQAELAEHRDHLEDLVGKRTTALRQAKDEADRANRTKSDFLANMSHEIRTPMTAILGYAEILREMGDLENAPPERIDAIDTIQRNGDHLLRLINDILDLSKLEAGMTSIETTTCSPTLIARDVLELMMIRADAKELTLRFRHDGAIPATIETDPTRLRQILVNLVGNAIKFTARGCVDVTMRLLDPVEASAPRLAFAVSDTGIGLNADHRRAIFEPFTQGDTSTSRRFGGTGLGLSISRRLAMLLGGDIEVRSQSGAGSTFTVTVGTGPLARVPMIEDAEEVVGGRGRRPDDPARMVGASAAALEGRRILVAEDTPDNQRLIRYHLERYGADVEVVSNGREAVERWRESVRCNRVHDAILMDIQMPEMDGFTATGILRGEGFRGPIIALTANTMRGDRDRCMAVGMNDHVAKPIDPAALLALLTGVIEPGGSVAPSGGTGSNDRVLDVGSLRARFAETPELLDELIGLFLDESERQMDALRAAAKTNDRPAIRRHAHTLKGCAGNFVVGGVTAAAERLEAAAAGEGGDAASIEPAVEHLAAELTALQRSLRALHGERVE